MMTVAILSPQYSTESIIDTDFTRLTTKLKLQQDIWQLDIQFHRFSTLSKLMVSNMSQFMIQAIINTNLKKDIPKDT